MKLEIRVERDHPVFSRLVGKKNRKDIIVCGEPRVLCSQLRTNGSWTAYEYRNLETLASRHYNAGGGFPQFILGENLLEKGYFFLLTGDYQGKPCNPRIILHPEDFIRLCSTESNIAIADRQREILQAHGHTGKERKVRLEQIKPENFELIQLTNLGLLKTQGRGLGLTTEGRKHLQ